MHTTELLSVLYELSLTNLKHLNPKDTAESFVKKFISRKSLNAGSVWSIEGVVKDEMKLRNIYATPVTSKKAFINVTRFRKLFGKENFIVTQESLISSRNMQGSYAYFKLNDFGLLELFYNGMRDSFTREGFQPFEDVIAQFAISLESGFFNQKLQEEIDNRVAAEKQLKTNESKYRRIIDNIKLGLLEVDNNEIIQHANTAFLESTGYDLEELIGKKASDALLNEESKKTIAAQNKARKKGESGSYEVKIKDKKGNDRWFIISGAPNYDKSGNIIGSIGIHLDITDEKILKQENEFKTGQLNKLFEMSLDALISINSRGEVFEWSPQAEKIFGYSKNEIMGKRLSDTIIPHQHRDGHENGMKNYLTTGHGPVLNQRIEIIGMRKTGEIFPVELTVFPLEHNNEKYFTAFVRDITEIKESKEEMERALERQKELNSMKSKFISMTSHELRTPLTTIRSNTELLNYQLDNVEKLKLEKLKKNVIRIENNVDRLNQLINNILMIGKLDSEKIPFSPNMMDVCEFISGEILPDFESRNQKINCAKNGEPRKVELDTVLFTHIMINLLENAIKYSPENDVPKLEITFDEDGLEIKVIDYGIGIPEEEQEKLFDTFYRASNVDNIQGTGLGLTIVKQFVELHAGTIKIESEVGKGSSFILNFPYRQRK